MAAELIAASRGTGCMIMPAAHFLAKDVVFVGIGLIATFAFTLDLGAIEGSLVAWKGRL